MTDARPQPHASPATAEQGLVRAALLECMRLLPGSELDEAALPDGSLRFTLRTLGGEYPHKVDFEFTAAPDGSTAPGAILIERDAVNHTVPSPSWHRARPGRVEGAISFGAAPELTDRMRQAIARELPQKYLPAGRQLAPNERALFEPDFGRMFALHPSLAQQRWPYNAHRMSPIRADAKEIIYASGAKPSYHSHCVIFEFETPELAAGFELPSKDLPQASEAAPIPKQG